GLRQAQIQIADETAKRDIGLGEFAAEIPRLTGMGIEMDEGAGKLRHAAHRPFMRDALRRMEVALIDDGDRLFHAAGRHGDRLQDLAALIAIAWSEGFLRDNHLIEIVGDGADVFERLTTIEPERGDDTTIVDF